jgi:hypothetical protein
VIYYILSYLAGNLLVAIKTAAGYAAKVVAIFGYCLKIVFCAKVLTEITFKVSVVFYSWPDKFCS